MALTKDVTSAIIKEYGKNEKDTGSPEVQVALLILVGKRHSLLDYLRSTDADRYAALIKKLGLRK